MKRSSTPTTAEREKVAKTLPENSTKLSWERVEHVLMKDGMLYNDLNSLWSKAPIFACFLISHWV